MLKHLFIVIMFFLVSCSSSQIVIPNIYSPSNYTINGLDRIIDLRKSKIHVEGDLNLCSDDEILMPQDYYVGGKLFIGRRNECKNKS